MLRIGNRMVVSLFLIFAMVLSPMGITVAESLPTLGSEILSEPYFLGSGTQAEPYEIRSSDELIKLAELINAENPSYDTSYYVQKSDIDLSHIADWTPIGLDESCSFNGHYDGNEYTISGLKISVDSATSRYFGLFGWNTGSIKDLNIQDCDISVNGAGDIYSGALAGYSSGTINNIHTSGKVNGTSYTGGIIGLLQGGTIETSYNSATVTGTTFAGGIAGNMINSMVRRAYNSGTVSGSENVGGISGYTQSVGEYSLSNILNVYNKGTVLGTGNVGGIAGQSFGGITIDYTYNTGLASGGSSNGAIVGYQNAKYAFVSNIIRNSYFLDNMTLGIGSNTYGTSSNVWVRTSMQMQDPAMFPGFDFSTPIWEMPSQGINDNYPVLVDVGDGLVDSIRLFQSPDKLEYIYDSPFDPSGGKIEVTTASGVTVALDLDSSWISGFDSTILGEQILTITYKGKTATFKVIISNEPINTTGIAVINLPTKVIYLRGDPFDVSGGILRVTQTSGSTWDRNLTADMISGYDPHVLGQQTITVTYSGQQDTFVVDVIPTWLTVSPFNYNQLRLSWLPVSGASSYRVYRAASPGTNYSLIKTLSATSYTDGNLVTGAQYFYKILPVSLVNGVPVAGTVYSNTSDARPVLNDVTGVRASAASASSIKLAWNSVSGATIYNIYKTDLENSNPQLLVSTTSTSFTHKVLTPGIEQYYVVKAVRVSSGATNLSSQYSSVVHSHAGPLQVTGLVARSVSYDRISLTWNVQSGVSGYKIYRQIAGVFREIGSTTTATTFDDDDLICGTSYTYAVKAVSGTIIGAEYSLPATRTPVPNTVTGVSASSAGTSSIRINWYKLTPNSVLANYSVYRSTSKSGPYIKIGTSSSSSFTDTDVNTGKVYYYKLLVTINSTSSPSLSAFAFAKAVPPAPTGLIGTPGVRSATISWDSVTGATGYHVYRSSSLTGSYSKVGTTTQTSFTNSGLTSGKTYYYKIRTYTLVGTTSVLGTTYSETVAVQVS